jgi:hypothetical protein
MKMLSAGMSGVSEDKKQGQMPVNVQMQTIIKERYIGTGFICVVGVRRGVGCTTMAAAVANYLAAEGKKRVALVELTQYAALQWSVKLHKNVDVYTQSNGGSVKLYHDDVKNLLEEIPCQDYDFIVLDLGIVFEPETDSEKRKEMVQYKVHQFKGELLRSSLTVLVAGSGPWDYIYFEPYLRHMEKALANWVVVTVGDPGKSMRSMIEEKTERVLVAPYVSGPLSSELDGLMEELLSAFLPAQLPQEKKKFCLWG